MIRPFLLTLAFLVSIAALTGRKHPTSASGPMGIGDDADREALRAWNLERLADPATGRIPADIRAKELAFAKHLPHRNGAKSLEWTRQGPRNRGGRTRAFRVDITDSNVLLAGSATGGIWRSTDAGTTWTKTSAPMDIQNTSCFGQDVRSGHTQTWYCGTGENYGVVSGTDFEALLPGDGIFKSTDGGLSWQRLESTVSDDPQVFDRKGAFKHVNAVVVDPVRMDSDIVVAAIFDGIVRSNDGGITWKPVLGLDTTVTTTSLYTDVRVNGSGVYYAAIGNGAAYKGIWRSLDGLTWTRISVGVYPAAAERTVMAFDPQDQNKLWLFCESPGTGTHGHSLYRYRYLGGDGSGAGGEWINKSANLPNGTCTGFYDFDFGYINSQTSYDMAIAVSPADSNVVFIGGTSVYRSTNGWSTPDNYRWVGGYQCDMADPKNYMWPNHHPDQHWLEFPSGDASKLYSTNDGGVHVTFDPLQDSIHWQVLNDGYFTSQFYTVAIEQGVAGSPYILGGMQDNGCYLCTNSDPAVPWASVHGSDGAYCAIPDGRAFMLMSGQQGKLYKKTVADDGTVTGFERIDPDITNPSYNFINQFVLDPATQNRLYWCHSNRLWRNNDLASLPITNNYYTPSSTNWEQLTTTNQATRITALDIGASDPNTLIFGTSSGRVHRVDDLNGTPVRTQLTSPEFPPVGTYVGCIAPNDNDPNEWVVAFTNYGVRSVFHTTDRGATWESISGNLEENPDGSGNGPAVFWAAIYPTWNNEANRYFVGTSTGLYSTAELNGDSTVWEQEGPTSIGNVPINMIVTRGSDGLIVVGTHGSGVFTSHLPAAPVGVADADAERALAHAWPVPAVSEVHVPVYVPQAGNVLADVFDGHGRLIVRHNLGTLPAGNTRFTWDLRDAWGGRVVAGTYLVRITTGAGGTKVERVVVL